MPGWLATVAVGALSGVLAGTFGIGGGLVTTPAIRLLLARPALVAVGTPLAVIIPTAVAGVFSHARGGRVDWRTGLIVGVSGAPLAMAGAWLSDVAGGPLVLLVTAGLVLWMAVSMLTAPAPASGEDESEESGEEPERPPIPVLKGVVVGLVAGAYAGFLGLGGGFVIVPLLVRWARFGVKRAVAASLVAIALLAVPGALAHSALGHVDWTLALGMTVGGVPGAWVGGLMSRRARSVTLRRGFAVVLVLSGIALAANEVVRWA